MKKFNIIFDTSNFVHRTYHVFKFKEKDFDLDDPKHRARLIRKVMIDYQSIIRNLKVDNVFFCFDNGSFRKSIYSEYKAQRTPNKGLNLVFEELYNLFEFKGINAIMVKGLEADDCIAILCETLENNIIISQDEDLRQLVNENTYVLTPINRNRTLYKHFNSEDIEIDAVVKEIDPEEIIIDKLLKGCKSDNIPRLTSKSIRRKTVESILDEFTFNPSSLTEIINKNKIGASYNEVVSQLNLVCLKSEFMPEESVEEIMNKTFYKPSDDELHMDSILSNTVYWL